MKYKYIPKPKGQILVIVLIVMLLLAITVVTLSNNTVRDIQQSQFNTNYQDNYSVAENALVNSVTSAQIDGNTLMATQVRGEFTAKGYTGTCAETTAGINKTVTCDLTQSTSQNISNKVAVKIDDSDRLQDIELKKDESVLFRLGPTYSTGRVDVSWSNTGTTPIALEMIFDFNYTDPDGLTRSGSVRDIYEPASNNPKVFPNLAQPFHFIFYPNTSNPNNAFYFNYQELIPTINNSATNANREMPHFIGTGSTITPLGFRIKPYIDSDGTTYPTLFLNVSANPSPNMIQSRIYETTSFSLNTSTNTVFGPQPFVSTSVPYYKDTLFDYVLRVNSIERQ